MCLVGFGASGFSKQITHLEHLSILNKFSGKHNDYDLFILFKHLTEYLRQGDLFEACISELCLPIALKLKRRLYNLNIRQIIISYKIELYTYLNL